MAYRNKTHKKMVREFFKMVLEHAYDQYNAELGELDIIVNYMKLCVDEGTYDYFDSELFEGHCHLLRYDHLQLRNIIKHNLLRIILTGQDWSKHTEEEILDTDVEDEDDDIELGRLIEERMNSSFDSIKFDINQS